MLPKVSGRIVSPVGGEGAYPGDGVALLVAIREDPTAFVATSSMSYVVPLVSPDTDVVLVRPTVAVAATVAPFLTVTM